MLLFPRAHHQAANNVFLGGTMADEREASSDEYSGVVEEATCGVYGKASTLAKALSSGTRAKNEREKRKAQREREEKEEEEEREAKEEEERQEAAKT